ncbi:MAG: hypothetical protein DHS20C08_07610 [Rhodomicrobium sp.]|nr:MAG: hypothetical protein DHS20C08_07610 [Rhodomicrobium sp.]
MRNIIRTIWLSFIILMCTTTLTLRTAYAEDKSASWEVIKMSGEAWVSSDGLKRVSLNKGNQLSNGDELRTGNNGRILLKRGEETILVTPNSAMSLPKQQPGAGKTQILQQAGEILLEVEKRNVKHFEVSTPYLAAVVKGTRFSVKVDGSGAKVDVLRGKVEVMDLKTGKFVLVKPGQFAAITPSNGKGLNIGGTGVKDKIKQGTPRQVKVKPLNLKVNRGLNQAVKSTGKPKKAVKAAKVKGPKLRKTKVRRTVRTRAKTRLKIGRALGHTRLNIAKATKGLSRNKGNRVVGSNEKSSWAKTKTKVATKLDNGSAKLKTNNGNAFGKNNVGNSNSGNNNAGNNAGNGLSLGLTNGNGNGNGIGIGVTGGLPPGLGGIPPGLAKKLGL